MSALAAALAVVVAALPSAAQEHFDVLLYEDENGELAAGAVDVDTEDPFLGVHVIEGEMLGDSLSATPTWVAEEPGFFSYGDATIPAGFPGDNLPGNASISLDFLIEPTLGLSLAYWDDVNGVWDAPGAGDSIMMSTLLDPGGSIDGSSEVLDMVLDSTGGDGLIDEHPTFFLSSGSPEGVYLAFGLAEVAGFADPSDTFWFVFGTIDECEETESCNAQQEAFNEDIEEQIEAAIAYTNAFLVPEPSTGLLVALGLVGLCGARSRERV